LFRLYSFSQNKLGPGGLTYFDLLIKTNVTKGVGDFMPDRCQTSLFKSKKNFGGYVYAIPGNKDLSPG
jgi:hypothetical protein